LPSVTRARRAANVRRMVDARFSALACPACAVVSAVSGTREAWAVCVAFGLLAAGFLARAVVGFRRR